MSLLENCSWTRANRCLVTTIQNMDNSDYVDSFTVSEALVQLLYV